MFREGDLSANLQNVSAKCHSKYADAALIPKRGSATILTQSGSRLSFTNLTSSPTVTAGGGNDDSGTKYKSL